MNKIKGSMGDAQRQLRQLDELGKTPRQTGLTIDLEFTKSRRFDGGKKAEKLSFAETIILDPQYSVWLLDRPTETSRQDLKEFTAFSELVLMKWSKHRRVNHSFGEKIDESGKVLDHRAWVSKVKKKVTEAGFGFLKGPEPIARSVTLHHEGYSELWPSDAVLKFE